MHLSDARSAYLGNSVTTASPARLLVMLVERLALDVERALEAQQASLWADAHRHLLHAQDIVVELATSLEPTEMSGGTELAMLYEYLRGRLVDANIRRDEAITGEALAIATGLAETWRAAALSVAAL